MSADGKLLATVTVARISKCTKFLEIGYLAKIPKVPIAGTVICFILVIAEKFQIIL